MKVPRAPFWDDWLGLAAALAAAGGILTAVWALLSAW